jgi:hypothetical protein
MLLDKAMYPLREAAALTGIEACFLVKEAIERNLCIYAELPPDLRVLSVHASHRGVSIRRSLARNSVEEYVIPPFAVPAVQFLVIAPPSLVGVSNVGRDQVSHFEEGISFARDGQMHSFDASVSWEIHDAFDAEEVPLPLRSYALYPLDFAPPWNNPSWLRCPEKITVTWDNLYVKRTDLIRFVKDASSRTAPLLKRIESWEGRHISPNLRGLRSLLIDELKVGSSEHLKTLPREVFKLKLKAKFGFSGSQASAGAIVILRSMDALYQIEHHAGEHEPAILALFECADRFWGNAVADTESHPSLDEIVAWLQGTLGITDTPAKGCAAMIRPDWVSQGGRKKKPAAL